MDVVKLIIVVLVLILFVALVAVVVGSSTGATIGKEGFDTLDTAPEAATGVKGDWAPMDVMTHLIWLPFTNWGIDFEWFKTIFTSMILVLGIWLVVRIGMRVLK